MSSNFSSKNGNSEARRGVITARILTQIGTEQGVDMSTLLASTGLTDIALQDDGTAISLQQEIQLIRNLQQALPAIQTLGLIAGNRYHLPQYGLWGYAVVGSPNWGSAINVAIRMVSQYILLTKHRTEKIDNQIVSLFDTDHLPADIRQFALDRDRACMLKVQRDVSGVTLPYIEVQMRRESPAPEVIQAYVDNFGVEPKFGQQQDSASFSAEVLSRPLNLTLENTLRQYGQMCRDLVDARHRRTGVAGKVRDRLLQTPGHIPDMEEIAAEWNMTSRTLRRHLTAEGATFRDLLEEVRSTLAEELMTQANLTHGEIAERLGYADVTTFIEAFRRWNGMAPSEFRRQKGLPSYTRRSARWDALLN